MPRRKPKTKSKKPKNQVNEDEAKKAELKEKLRQKLREKKLGRTSRVARENMADDLEERLEDDISAKERAQIKKRLAVLEDIEDKEYENLANSDFAGHDLD
jgi:hypothetical protein